MAKGAYIGVSGVAHKVKKPYVGVGGIARKVKNGYIGVSGVARKFFSSDLSFITGSFVNDHGQRHQVSYGAGVYVAIHSGNTSPGYNETTAEWSTDGKTWTASTLPVSARWQGVLFCSDNKFRAYAYDSTNRAVSSDGKTWAKLSDCNLPKTAQRFYINNGVCFAIGSSVYCWRSADGITWTSQTMPKNTLWMDMAFGNGVFVVCGNNYDYVAYSTDGGITWRNSNALPEYGTWGCVAYGNGMFIMSGARKTVSPWRCYLVKSTDGINWTQIAFPSGVQKFDYIVFCDGYFVAADNSGAGRVFTSEDGVNWKNEGSFSSQYDWAYGSVANNKCFFSASGAGWNNYLLGES